LVGVGHQFKPYNTSHRNKKVDKIGKDKHRKTVNGEEISIFSSSSIKSQKKNTKRECETHCAPKRGYPPTTVHLTSHFAIWIRCHQNLLFIRHQMEMDQQISIPIWKSEENKKQIYIQMAGGWQIPNKHGYSYIL